LNNKIVFEVFYFPNIDRNLEPNTTEEDPIHLAGLFEGDIVLPENFFMESKAHSSNHTAFNAIMYEQQKWPQGIVPYLISSDFCKSILRNVHSKLQ